MTEPEAVAYLMHLYELERDPDTDRATLSIGPFTAFTLIGALQLATRHPEMSEPQRALIGQLVDELRPLFARHARRGAAGPGR